MAPDPYKYFRIEARELLDRLGKGLLDLEKDSAAPDQVARLLRLAHTLKGAARVVKQREIADLAHTMEGALSPFREGARVPQEEVSSAFKMLDAMAPHVAALAEPADSSAGALADAAPDEPSRMLRADIGELDALLDGVTEVHVRLEMLGRSAKTVERIRRLTELLADQLASPRMQHIAGGATPKLRSLVDEMRILAGSLEQNLPTGIQQVDRELRQVRENAGRLRLLPAGLMFNSLERTARDAAHSLGRRVDLGTRGGDVRLDAHVLGVVQNALVQAVRNAVAHGIETPAERTALGKPPDGRIALEVTRRGNRVAFTCRDDGRGVDLEAVRRAAERKGVASADVAKLDAGELLRLLLRGGISTAGTVTEVSGRGIGLDVVREAASRLGGEAAVHTEPRRGTTLEIVVPVTLSSLEALVVEAGGQAAAMPLDAVRRTLRVGSADMIHSADGAAILFEGKVVPFAPLARALRSRIPATSAGRVWSTVVVEGAGSLAAFGVDRMLRTETVVLRPLPGLTPADPVVAGASLDTEGNPQIVLDPERLVPAAHEGGSAEPVSVPRPPILVIDDSLTTRMLEQSILESAGYQVDVATSGEEALRKAQAKQFALFLVDVEMPGMDGFTFIERSRADPVLRDIPAILVTSRGSPEDRERGKAVGARAYIEKSEFDQTELLERIAKLVG